MSKQKFIRSVIEGLVAKLKERPSIGQVTKDAVARCDVNDGLKIECSAGEFSFTVDVDKSLGGEGSAPNPGAYGRGAAAACIAGGCVISFARRELPFDGIRVTVEADMDLSSGSLAINDGTPGFSELRYTVEVDSAADPGELQQAIEEAAARSTMLQTFARPVPVVGNIRINSAPAVTG